MFKQVNNNAEKYAHLNDGLAKSAWPKFRCDNQNTGRGVGTSATGELKWKFKLNGEINSSATIGPNNIIYVGSCDKYMYALNGSNGELGWKYETQGEIYSSAAIAKDNTVYFGSEDENIYALIGSTGILKWKYKTNGMVWSSPAIGVNGTVYVGSRDNCLYALDGENGKCIWKFEAEDEIGGSSPAIGVDGIVYVGSEDRYLYALDGMNGDLKWRFRTKVWSEKGKYPFECSGVWSSPVVGMNGLVYVGGRDRYVYALDELSGELIWKYRTNDQIIASFAMLNNYIYVRSDDGFVYSFNSLNGEMQWKYNLKGASPDSPAVNETGEIYIQGYKKRNDHFYYLFSLNGKTGVLNWKYGMDTWTCSESSISVGYDGTIFIGNDDNYIYAIQ